MNTTLSDPPMPTDDDLPRPTEGELERRRAAIAALGHELRLLVDAVVRTTAPAEVLRGVAEGVRRITGRLTGGRRARGEVPVVDEFPGEPRMYSPVTGAGSPLAPPMLVTPGDGGLVGLCALGIAHEGPPGYVHGGMSAMLLDELMGRACGAAGHHAMTVSLRTRYHRPVPVDTPLRVFARVTGAEDRKIFVEGSISREGDRDGDTAPVLVTGEAVFVSPDPERARALFPELR
ncbi:PaaI family thioesterase [Streptomyces sp. NPDC002643]